MKNKQPQQQPSRDNTSADKPWSEMTQAEKQEHNQRVMAAISRPHSAAVLQQNEWSDIR